MEQKTRRKVLYLGLGGALIVAGILCKRVLHLPPLAVLACHATAFVFIMMGLAKE